MNEEFGRLTFSQREGEAPLPEPMRLKHVPQMFRHLVWRTIRTDIDDRIRHSGKYVNTEGLPEIIESYQFDVDQQQHNHIPSPIPSTDREFARRIVLDGKYHEIITFVEYILRHDQCTEILKDELIEAFDNCSIAYFVACLNETPTVCPRINHETGEATKNALEAIRDGGMVGAEAHFRKAAQRIISQEYGDSIQNSIHAVESVARNISPKSRNSLKPALDTLKNEGILKHPTLRKGFEQLYGYTSDEQGIRHSLLDRDAADAGPDEAMFMFGAFASFTAYLVNKHLQRDRQE